MITAHALKAADRLHRTGSFKKHHLICVFFLTAWIGLFSACGKKGPPTPPAHVSPPIVKGLEITLENDVATLHWPVPEWDEKGDNSLAGFFVYRAGIALDGTECEDCPLRFNRVGDVRVETSASSGIHEERLEKGFKYFFKVSAYTDSGYEGESSAIVTVTYDNIDNKR